MLQNAKNKAIQSPSFPEEAILFKSEVGLFLVYLLLRTAPIVAVVFYCSTYVWAVITAVLLIIGLLSVARLHNHRFLLTATDIQITPSFWGGSSPISYSYADIKQATVKLSQRGNKRQWLALQEGTGHWIRYRCDWLHQQDPPSVDEHDDDRPQHELFELLDEENFYKGSLQHLASMLQQKGVSVTLS